MNRLGRGWVLSLGLLALAGTSACKEAPPEPAELHRDKGNEALAKSDWKQAADEYALSLQADPKQEKIWEKKAYVHKMMGEMDQADEAILHLADFRSEPAKKAEIYRNLAGQYVQSQTPDKAEKYFLKTLELDPKDDLSLGWLAEIYAQRGGAKTKNPPVPDLLEKSFTYYDKVISLKPEFPNTYINKRIALKKYMEYVQSQKTTAEVVIKSSKDKAKIAEMKAQAEQAQARLDDFQKQYDELTTKFTTLVAAAKAAKAAQGQAAGTPAAPAEATSPKP